MIALYFETLKQKEERNYLKGVRDMYEVVLETQRIKVKDFDAAAELCAALDKLGVEVEYMDEEEESEEEAEENSNMYKGYRIRTV